LVWISQSSLKASDHQPLLWEAAMKVAVIQLDSKPLEVETNFAAASKFIRDAAGQGAELAVLPEYHLTSWVPHSEDFAKVCANWEEQVKNYQDLARECNICIVPGTIVQKMADTENNADKLFNVAYFIDKSGTILSSYTKKNLWHPERDHLTSSGREQHIAFDTPFGKAGMLVCWDLAFPEAFRHLILQGAQLIIIPSYWGLGDCSPEGLAYNPSSEGLFLDTFVTARAFENTCSIIFCNAGGRPGQGCAGLSQVAVPFIGPIARIGTNAEGMLVVDLDMEIAKKAERNYRIREDLARTDWHYDYFRDDPDVKT
jgi:predicted amidohydrolase